MNESIQVEKIQFNSVELSLKFIVVECESFRNFENLEILKKKCKGAFKTRKIYMMQLLIVNFF